MLGGVQVSQGPRGRPLEPADVAERSAGAVGVVITDTGRGMGFVVDPAGYLVTNRHVVEDAEHIEAVHFPGLDPMTEYTQVEIVYIDPIRDLALLHLSSDEALPALALATDERAPVSKYIGEQDAVVLLSRELDPAEAAALEHDPGLLIHPGRVERLEVYNPSAGPGAFMGVTARIEQGQSGGPVLDRYGRVVGVVTWTWRDQKGGFAIPISELPRMLSERPALDTAAEIEARAEERVRAYIAALGTGAVDPLRRLTSPSLAREVRARTVDVLIERGAERSVIQGFMIAIDEVLTEGEGDPFSAIPDMVGYASSPEVMRQLGVEGEVSSAMVEAFFTTFGTAYMAARLYGEGDREGSLMTALQQVHSLDTARSMALVDTLGQLAGVRAQLERVEVSSGLYGARAVATVDVGGGRKLAIQMRLEWGDWYVSEVQIAESLGPEPAGVSGQAAPDQSAPIRPMDAG